jgi:hypothetical protein
MAAAIDYASPGPLTALAGLSPAALDAITAPPASS